MQESLIMELAKANVLELALQARAFWQFWVRAVLGQTCDLGSQVQHATLVLTSPLNVQHAKEGCCVQDRGYLRFRAMIQHMASKRPGRGA